MNLFSKRFNYVEINMNLQIFDFNNFFKKFINSPNIIKTSFDI